MKRFLTDAISEKLDAEADRGGARPWMRHFGVLVAGAVSVRELDQVIEDEFGRVDPADWR